jgi:hypothetical protein
MMEGSGSVPRANGSSSGPDPGGPKTYGSRSGTLLLKPVRGRKKFHLIEGTDLKHLPRSRRSKFYKNRSIFSLTVFLKADLRFLMRLKSSVYTSIITGPYSLNK